MVEMVYNDGFSFFGQFHRLTIKSDKFHRLTIKSDKFHRLTIKSDSILFNQTHTFMITM